MSKVDDMPTTPRPRRPRADRTPFVPDRVMLALMGQGDPHMVEAARIIRGLPDDQAQAWLRCGERMAGGMPHAEAEAMMRAECGLPNTA